MKKILSILLCLVLAVGCLVSCGEDIIGGYIDQYEGMIEPPKPHMSLNLYIICGAETTDNAKVTVQQRIADYTENKYNTTVNVKYISEADYADVVAAKLASDAEDRADIFLVTSAEMMNAFYEGGNLADLTDFLAGKTYGTLNAQIASSLLKASAIKVEGIDRYYCIPNNHVVGFYDSTSDTVLNSEESYELLVIKKSAAQCFFFGSQSQLDSFTSYESTEALRAAMDAHPEYGFVSSDCVKVVNGNYEDILAYINDGYACNVLKYPEATVEGVYSSAFAINSALGKNADRAMEIVFAINNDIELRNYLQYGIQGTNYVLENDVVVRSSEGNSVYYMNPLHTGNIFNMHYCEELGWTATVAANASIQNKASIFAPEVPVIPDDTETPDSGETPEAPENSDTPAES